MPRVCFCEAMRMFLRVKVGGIGQLLPKMMLQNLEYLEL